MSEANEQTSPSYLPAHSAAAVRMYFTLFGIQTIGAVMMLWNGVPLYRRFLADPGSYQSQAQNLVWVFASISLIQVGYWICVRLRPPLPRLRNALLGTFTLFLGRLSFVFATSVFGVLFITQRSEVNISLPRYALTLIGLFSLFCYVQEMERLGRTLLGRER